MNSLQAVVFITFNFTDKIIRGKVFSWLKVIEYKVQIDKKLFIAEFS